TAHQAHHENLFVSWDEITTPFKIKKHAGHPLNGMHPFEHEGENDADKGHQGTKKGNAQRSLFCI
ncbi:MAG: hypothetical protein MR770_04275, partial [Desulfovibrio piger]|nr:hypothetical protein [Desulfovibrio piger]